MTQRRSGVLMPISSLPGPYGIGNFGESARQFVDFLVRTQQTYWQVLPLGTLSYGDSPYQSFSAFAGNTYFIDFDQLIAEGLLIEDDVRGIDFGQSPEMIDYAKLYEVRRPILARAVANFHATGTREVYQNFLDTNKHWLDDFALYMAIKEHFDNKSWLEWPDEAVRQRQPEALARYTRLLATAIQYHQTSQYFFFKQWHQLKIYANEQGIQMIGDMPIYVSADSSDIWKAPHQFKTDEQGRPTVIAGYPPDAFSETGQLWGNPLYDWEAMRADNYQWWQARMAALFKLYDIVRIDHFLGFNAFWEIPAGDETAKNGRWVKGPGYDLFANLKAHLGELPIIAEDLGLVTPEVEALLAATGFPGMKILQFAYDPYGDSGYMPHNCDYGSVVYTGTHDHNTIRGWYDDEISLETQAFFNQYSHRQLNETASQAMIRQAWSTASHLAITSMQDLLDLGGHARMNAPGTLGQNWRWRMQADAIQPEMENWLRDLTQLYRRTNDFK